MCAPPLVTEIGGAASQAGSANGGSLMTRPLREVTTYLVLAFSLAIGIAVAMPYAGINVLLSAFAPLAALLVITFTTTPRGKRKELWGSFGLNRSGKRLWPFALGVP